MENTKKILAMGLFVLLGLVIMNFGVDTSQASMAPQPIRGYVFNETGDPVVGALVTLTIQGKTNSTTYVSNSLGWFEVRGENMNSEVTETFTLRAYKAGVGISDLMIIAPEDRPGQHNLTLLPVTETLFGLSVFCYDAEGVGVANTSVSLQNALGVYFNGTTDEFGHYNFSLAPAVYSWSAITDVAGLNNRTGSIEIIDAARTLNIDLSVPDEAPAEFTLFGFGVSRTCLVIMVIGMIVVLGYLFLRIMKR